MQLIFSRTIPFVDTQSLEADQAREVLFRNGSGFVLYLSGGDVSPAAEERVISLDLREALIWLNEASQHRGSFWS
jgi:hypothetical protein